MANGDIYKCKFNFSTNNRAWSFGTHVQEINPISEEGNGQIVAEAVQDHFRAQLQTCISQQSQFESVECWKLWVTPAMPGKSVVESGAGVRPGDSLPNDNALVLQLRQSAGAAKYNGMVFLAGQSETDHILNDWDTTYLETFVEILCLRFLDQIDAVSPAGGSWRTVVLSEKIEPQTTPVGVPLDVVQCVPTTRVMSQRRRKQKADGWSV